VTALSDIELQSANPEFLNPSAHVVQKTKDNLTLECFTKYTAPMSMEQATSELSTWTRASGRPLPESAKIDIFNNLHLINIQTEDADIYSCNVTLNGRSITQRNILIVYVPPAFTKQPQNVKRLAPQTARFECDATGEPVPKIKWLKNGEELILNGRVKKKSDSNTLVISQTVAGDSGYYQCLAANDVGIAVSSARLFIIASINQPSAPTDLRAFTLSSSSIYLTWKSEDTNIKAFTIHYMPSNGGHEVQTVVPNNSVIIEKLLSNTSYTFYIRSYSGRSASEQSEPVQQATYEDLTIDQGMLDCSNLEVVMCI